MTQDKNNTNQTAPKETGEIKSPTNTGFTNCNK